MSAIFDPEPVGRPDEFPVIDLDSADHQPPAVKDDTLGIFMRDDPHMLRVDFIVGDANCAVGAGCQPGAIGDVTYAGRAIDLQRRVPPTEFLRDAAGHRNVEQAGIMIGMVMRDDDRIDTAHPEANLRQADGGPAPTVDKDTLAAGLDQRRCAEGVDLRVGNAGSQKRDLEKVVLRSRVSHCYPRFNAPVADAATRQHASPRRASPDPVDMAHHAFLVAPRAPRR